MADKGSSIFLISETRHQYLKVFYDENNDTAEFMDLCLNIAYAINLHILKCSKTDKSLLWPGQLLQTLHRYFLTSIILILSKCLDEGMAILRMAAELVRDIKCILKDANLTEIFLERDSDDSKKKAL